MSDTIKKLSDCKKASILKITKLSADAELKRRLISFGIMKDAVVEVLEHAPAKSTIEIKVGKTRIALRAKEAEQIEVVEI